MGYAKYTYDGPVMEFDRVITERWFSITYAPTEKKARANLVFQYKKQYSKAPNAKITLPGKVALS